jgi:hypothetical protein
MTARPSHPARSRGARPAVGSAADPGVWARLAALEGEVLQVDGRKRLFVAAVTASGVYVRTGAQPTVLLDRRTLREALPYVAAGQPLPGRLRGRAARLTAVLRAAGVGPGA